MTPFIERPEIAARKSLGIFLPVTSHHQYNAGASGEPEPSAVDIGLLVVSGALRVVAGDEAEGGEHQLFYPAQFCLVRAGERFRWKALVGNTSFYQVWIINGAPKA